MTFKAHLGQERAFRTVVVLLAYLVCRVICETGDCRQQEYRDGSGNCVLCKQCGPGMELSKECGFGYGEDARCLTCRPHRFKEDWGFQKCKPCLECAVVNRFQKANCSVTSDAVCGDCLPGFYRKTKLVGFQDMECVPCGDPPPPYEPHSYCRTNAVADFLDYCNAANFEGEFDPPGKNKEVCVSPAPSNPCASACGHSNVTPSVASCPHLHRHQGWKETQKCRCPRTSKVNLVKIPSTASSPRDTALAAVICSALATVLLALLVLCVIYCKRQFMEKKPSWSLRAQDIQYNGSELSCFDRPQLNGSAPRPCCKCHRDSAQTCGPVHLIPSLCCDEACSIDRVTLGCRVHSKTTLQERSICGEFSDAWPLMQNPVCGDDISFCDSDPELTGEDVHPLSPENHCSFSSDSDSRQDSVGGALPIQARPENLTDAADFSRPHSSLTESVLTQATLPARRQLHQESGDMTGLTAQTSLQEKNTDGTQQALTPPLGLMD